MLKHKNLSLIIIAIIITSSSFTYKSYGSESYIEDKSLGVFIVPQFLFINGFRLDFERNLKNNNNAIVFSPEIYTGQISEFLNESDDKVKGAGLSLIYKHYLYSSDIEEAPGNPQFFEQSYFGGIGGYNFFSIIYNDDEWVEVGNEILSQRIEKNLIINRISIGVMYGMVFHTDIGLVLDIYIGSGIQMASLSHGENTPGRDYTYGMVNYGYEGVSLLIGMKIGAFLN